MNRLSQVLLIAPEPQCPICRQLYWSLCGVLTCWCNEETQMNDSYIVICRDDTTPDGIPGSYVLATRRIFNEREAAVHYAGRIAEGREAIVVEGKWDQLRPGL